MYIFQGLKLLNLPRLRHSFKDVRCLTLMFKHVDAKRLGVLKVKLIRGKTAY